jgi:hypothetical protein
LLDPPFALPDDPLAPPELLVPAVLDVPPVVPPVPSVVPPAPGRVPPAAAVVPPPEPSAPPAPTGAPPFAPGAAPPLEKPPPAAGVTPGVVPAPELQATRKNSEHNARTERDPPVFIALAPYTRDNSGTPVRGAVLLTDAAASGAPTRALNFSRASLRYSSSRQRAYHGISYAVGHRRIISPIPHVDFTAPSRRERLAPM